MTLQKTTPPRLVVDTNVISSIFKGHTLGPVYERKLIGTQTILSFQTLAELDEWTRNDGWSEHRKQRLHSYLQQYTLIQSDDHLCRLWAEVRHAARRAGRPIDPADAWIAATALALRCPLVTHNAADYAGVSGLNVISENE